MTQVRFVHLPRHMAMLINLDYNETLVIVNMWLKRYLLLAWAVFICYGTYYVASTQKQIEESLTQGHFWVFSDAHVDVLYRAGGDPATRCRNVSSNDKRQPAGKFGHSNCDAPIQLLHSAFSAAKQIDSKVDFLIWLGDATSHLFRNDDTLLVVHSNLTRELRKHFPQTLIIPALGNHDIVLTTNRSTRFRTFIEQTRYDLWLTDANARQTFIKGGYYSLRYRSSLRFVALNTAMFQPQYMSNFDSHEAPAQIAWFNRTMIAATRRHERVLLLAHAPFGINEDFLYKFYDIKYEQQLLSIIDTHAKQIAMCLVAHRHRDIFRVYSSRTATMGMLGQPSITPISSLTEPSIRRYSYDRKSFTLLDYSQYSMNLIETARTQTIQWSLNYDFSSWFAQSKSITSSSLLNLVHLIRDDLFYQRRFLLLKHYAQETILTRHTIIQTLCALTLFNFDEYLMCTWYMELSHNRHQIKVESIVMNYSQETNVHADEQLIEYRRIYRRVAVSFFIVILFVFWIVNRVHSKYFCQIDHEK